jgi:hypothetical protein
MHEGEIPKGTWLIVAALSLASCRGYRELCEADGCAVAAAGDQGGASSEQPSSLAGAPGAAGTRGGEGEPECSDDADCDDERTCSGRERCVDERCVPGDDVECYHGTDCVEASAELCVYRRPSPWVIAMSLETVVGLPLDELEEDGEMIQLAQQERARALTGFAELWWSADGRFALVRSLEDRVGTRMHLLRFGAGLPSKLESIPDLPNWGDFLNDPVFSEDSKRVVIVDNYSGTYVVDLTDPAAPVTTLSGSDGPDSESVAIRSKPCASPNTWVARDEDDNYILTSRSNGELTSTPLGGDVTVSPDGRLLAVALQGDEEGEQRQIELRPCSSETWVTPLGPGYGHEFSPDSQNIALELTEYSGGMSLISLADPQSPKTIWSDAAASPPYGPWFTPDGARLMPQLRESPDEDLTLHVLDVTNGETRTLGLPPYTDVAAMGAHALLAWAPNIASEPRDLLWQAFEREAAPLVILNDSAQHEAMLHDVRFDRESVFISRPVGDDTEVGMLRFDASEPVRPAPVILPGSLGMLEPARDRRSLLLTMMSGLMSGNVFSISYSEAGEASKPRLLFEGAWFVSIQPW